MALEGQLSDFNLAEILQLLASQQKSGFLNLETNRNMVFIFDKGVLISTRDRRSRSRDPLESFLRAYGFLNEQQWKHIEYVGKNSSLDLTEILISEGIMNPCRNGPDPEEPGPGDDPCGHEAAAGPIPLQPHQGHASGCQMALQPGRAGAAHGGRPAAGRGTLSEGVLHLPGDHLHPGQEVDHRRGARRNRAAGHGDGAGRSAPRTDHPSGQDRKLRRPGPAQDLVRGGIPDQKQLRRRRRRRRQARAAAFA